MCRLEVGSSGDGAGSGTRSDPQHQEDRAGVHWASGGESDLKAWDFGFLAEFDNTLLEIKEMEDKDADGQKLTSLAEQARSVEF